MLADHREMMIKLGELGDSKRLAELTVSNLKVK